MLLLQNVMLFSTLLFIQLMGNSIYLNTSDTKMIQFR